MLSSVAHLQKIMQTKIYQLGHLLPVFPASKLLADNRHQAIIVEIQQLSGLPESYFKALYRPALQKFAEFVQVIPDQPQGALGGLLNLGLSRSVLSLRQFATEAGAKFDADPLVNYAIFSAALFFDVARVISQQRVVIADISGQYLQDWYPYLGTMLEQGFEFYKIYPFNTSVYEALNHEAAALLARQLMPNEGFIWLSSDLELFIDWLDALRGGTGEGGRKISRSLALIRDEDLLDFMKSISQIQIDMILPKEMPLQDKFYIWLREGISKGSIEINTKDAHLHLLDNGILFINNEIFKRFLESNKTPGDVNKLSRDFAEEFALSSRVTQEKTIHANAFLAHRLDQKSLPGRQGMLYFASLFIMNTAGIPMSPLRKDIMSGIHQARELPGVKQTIAVERRPDSGPSFKMR